MKKRFLIGIFIFITFITITGCGTKEEKNNDNKSLVLYFSATGNTKQIAEKIAKASNSDIIEIIPEEKYKKEDLDYNNDCRANREQNDNNARPKIANNIDITNYNTIYLGYPIWWGTNPKIILTLLDTYNLSNKTIIPFCTSGSSGINKSVNDLRNYNPKLNIKNGKRFSLNDSDKEIKEFVNTK